MAILQSAMASAAWYLQPRRDGKGGSGGTRLLLGQMRSISAEPSLNVSFDAASNAKMPPLQIGQFRAIPLPSGIHKSVNNAAKREKRNYTDSSNSEHSDTKTDGHRQGQIFRLPKGSSKEYGVYWKGKKITFGGELPRTLDTSRPSLPRTLVYICDRPEHAQPPEQRQEEGKFQRKAQVFREEGQKLCRVLGLQVRFPCALCLHAPPPTSRVFCSQSLAKGIQVQGVRMCKMPTHRRRNVESARN